MIKIAQMTIYIKIYKQNILFFALVCCNYNVIIQSLSVEFIIQTIAWLVSDDHQTKSMKK